MKKKVIFFWIYVFDFYGRINETHIKKCEKKINFNPNHFIFFQVLNTLSLY